MDNISTPEKEIEFFSRRLAQEEEAAARTADLEALIHQQLARDYSAALAAYRSLAASR